MDNKIMFSGIQPSGDIHIGNYLGAIKNWVNLFDKYFGIFCIVDYHAITVPYKPGDMANCIRDAAAIYLACGLTREYCIIFVQSDVPEHTELAWLFNTITPLGLLERMTQFKQKARLHEKNINAGLLTYPVLQAADILLYKAEAVPVGEDQAQHIELTREVAHKFNITFGEIFPEPETIISSGGRILGLDGVNKMSKSLNNHISLIETPENIWKKLSTAVTDVKRVRRSDPGRPEMCNIYTLHRSFSSEDEQKYCHDNCISAGIGCLDCKKILAENIEKQLEPIRMKKAFYDENPDEVTGALSYGAEQARKIASEVIKEVRDIMGIHKHFNQ